MLWVKRFALLLLIPLAVSACATAPKSMNDDMSTVLTRDDFLRRHPDGKYNAYVERGEVVRGMNLLEVAASWGIPDARWLSKDKKIEFWTFFSQDEISGDWTRYTFVFEDKTLVDWELSKHFAKNGTLTRWLALKDDRYADPALDGQKGGFVSTKH